MPPLEKYPVQRLVNFATDEDAFIRQDAELRGGSLNAAVRRMVRHCMECAFYLPSVIDDDKIPPAKSE